MKIEDEHHWTGITTWLLAISFIAIIIALSCGCSKKEQSTESKLIGIWYSDESYNFEIKNLYGEPNPFIVRINGDSLTVKLLPLIDLRMKIISVDSKNLNVLINNKPIHYYKVKKP